MALHAITNLGVTPIEVRERPSETATNVQPGEARVLELYEILTRGRTRLRVEPAEEK
jgi:hypothetical protein